MRTHLRGRLHFVVDMDWQCNREHIARHRLAPRHGRGHEVHFCCLHDMFPVSPATTTASARGCAKPFPPASYIAVLLRDASAFFVVHGALKDTNSFSTTDSLITKGSWNWENAASPAPQSLLHIQDDNTHGGFNVCASPARQSKLRQQRWCCKRRALRCGAGFCCWHLVGLPSDSSSGPSRCRGALARLFRPARPQMPQTKGRTRGQAYDAEWMNSFHNTCSNARHVVFVCGALTVL